MEMVLLCESFEGPNAQINDGEMYAFGAGQLKYLRWPPSSGQGPSSEVRARNWPVRFTLKNGRRQPGLSGPKVPESDLAGEIERWEKSGRAPILARWKRAFGISLAPVT